MAYGQYRYWKATCLYQRQFLPSRQVQVGVPHGFVEHRFLTNIRLIEIMLQWNLYVL